MNNTKLYTISTLAEYLGITTRTLATIKARGEIEFVRVGNQVRFTTAQVEAYLEKSTERVENGKSDK